MHPAPSPQWTCGAIAENRIARVLRKGQPRLAPSLADDAQTPQLPLDVAKPQRDDVTRAQTEAGQQKQNGAIAPRHGAWAIAGLDDALHIGLLHDFARWAAARGDTHARTETATAWPPQ